MRKVHIKAKSSIDINKSYQGETIEEMLERLTTTNEPIDSATVPPMYTERADGVLPETNIRTDRWEIAREAMEAVSKAGIAKRKSPEGHGETSGDTGDTGEKGV